LKRLGDKILQGYSLLVFAFLYIPIFSMIVFSFNDSRLTATWRGFTLKWYVSLIGNETLWGAFYNTITVAVIVTVASAILGTVTALAMSRYKFRGKNAFDAYLYIPIVIPEITEALSLLLLYVWGGVPLGLTTIILGHLTFAIPFAALVIRSRMAGFDRSVEEAAQSMGANEIQTFFRITLPIISTGVIAGALLAFTQSYDDFIKTAFTRGPGVDMLPTTIYNLARRGGASPELNALATVALSVSIVMAILWQKFSTSKS
jgi:spermidine/putrescine transport system permease protein